jgi:hypothetical protein
MIDHDLRRRLSQDLRRLATGRMTNDEFDEVYYEDYGGSQDAAVVAIAEFGYGFYSSDVLVPYRLKGRHALSKETRRMAARCVLFLRTGRRYEWPTWPGSAGYLRFMDCFAWVGLQLGSAFSVCFLMFLPLRADSRIAFTWPLVAFWPIGAISVAATSFGIWYVFCGGAKRVRRKSSAWQQWLRDGDWDAWPFRRREDCYEARRSCHLLSAETSICDAS